MTHKEIECDECRAELYEKDLVDGHCPECKHKIGD